MIPETPVPVLTGSHSYASVSDKIAGLVLRRPVGRLWLWALLLGLLGTAMFSIAVGYLFAKGVGIWGVNVPVGWAFAITNFVWWVGIGHAGTFISAFLLLMRQEWRTSINRFAEAMTLFAVACAGIMPLLHLGRPWFFYWLFPYPDTMGVWPQFRSPLIWDVFAVGTYATISLLFWYLGLLPDLATMRDQARSRALARIYGVLALGWRGSARHWRRYEKAYLLMAGIATPLVISVHSVVSLDFTAAIVPGWHSTIFPPYFVAGAIFSGFAMVLTLAIPMRKFFALEDFITLRHLENCAGLLLVTGMIVTYSYAMEVFMSWYSADRYERYETINRALGNYAVDFWVLVACNVASIQVLWWRSVRTNVTALFILSLVINIGMWVERFVIIVVSLSRDFLPSSWRVYEPTRWDLMTYAGSVGLFFTLFLLFARTLPVVSISETRKLLHERSKEHASCTD